MDANKVRVIDITSSSDTPELFVAALLARGATNITKSAIKQAYGKKVRVELYAGDNWGADNASYNLSLVEG